MGKMKASEVLKLYAEGQRDFRGVSIRGQSFKGKDLSGADFSHADICSANFTNAYLQGAKFVGAEAGLQKRWEVVLGLASWLLSGCFIFLSLVVTAIVVLLIFANNTLSVIAGAIYIAAFVFLWTLAIWKGTSTAFGCSMWAGILVAFIPFLLAIFLAFYGAVAAAIPVAIAGDVARVKIRYLAIAFAAIIFGSLPIALPIATALPIAVAIAFVLTIALVLLSSYVGWRAMRGDPRDEPIRSAAIALATKGGTSFRGADLSHADFTGATFKGTDLRFANLTQTIWKNAVKLDYARPGETYLSYPRIRKLVVTGKGENKKYNNLNLIGINLAGANLTNASFVEANLQDANLAGANLEGASLIKANLRDANLTKANLVGVELDEADLTGATFPDGYEKEGLSWI